MIASSTPAKAGGSEDTAGGLSAESALQESEARFRTLFDFAFDGVIFHDNGRILDANQGAVEISGYSREELLKTDLLDLLDEPSRELTLRKAALGVTTPYEVTMRRRDGSLLAVEGVGRPASYRGRAVRITVIRDISARRRAEQRQSDSESKFRLLTETSPAAILIMQGERTLYANPAAATLTGYSREDLLGLPFSELVELESAAAFYWRIISAERAEQHTERHELRLRGKDDREVWVDYMAARIEYEGAPAVLGTALDISARKRSEALNRRLIHADRLAAIGQLSAGVAHEINNPAAFVVANLHGLQSVFDRVEQWEGCVPAVLAEARDMLRDGLEGIERIHSIAKNLKTFSRIEHDDVELVDVNEVLSGACAIVADEIRGRARLLKQLGAVPRLAADPGKLSQLFINLLMNAAQAIDPRGAEQHEIRCTSVYRDGSVHVAIADTGCGMPESVKARIFEPFFTTKSRDLGTGLGLTLCADIVRRHSGEIRVESEPGKGSVFEVLLPGETGLVFSRKPELASEAPSPAKRARVLVIDDEEILLKAYRRMLSQRHDVVVARGGANALELLRTDTNFDVVLCDLMMPEVDGKSVYETLTALSPALAARVIFCSGGAFSARLGDFVAGLPNVTLDKPFTADALQLAVDTARSRR